MMASDADMPEFPQARQMILMVAPCTLVRSQRVTDTYARLSEVEQRRVERKDYLEVWD
jgi:hypothetical protein